jgi:hypothetical protein
VEPFLPDRPGGLFLWYKIEEGKEYFALGRDEYDLLRTYILQLEGSLRFAVEEIRENNEIQKLKTLDNASSRDSYQ